MKSLASWLVLGTVVLLLGGAAQAAIVGVTVHTAVSDPHVVTFSDGGGAYYDDWRIWKDNGGTPAIYDEKKNAAHISDVSVSQASATG